MEVNTINAKLCSRMFVAGAKNLEANKEWINELNVFPVPDGDTGTNMTMTIMAAAREVVALEDPDMEMLAKAISSGSLRGARGNSGVILSQLFRGFTKGIKKYQVIDKVILASAFQKAVETAYKAVMKPKEGTILTVAREAANKALELAETEMPMDEFLAAIIEEAELVLARTPEMLPVLKEAGVVDSGGQGLLLVLKGAYDGFLGKEVDYTIAGAAKISGGADAAKVPTDGEAEIRFGYCTEFIIMLEKEYTEKTEEEFKGFLESIGDSIVLVSDDGIVKVHVHTNDPGKAISRALSYGSLTSMKIDNMREEHHEKLIKDAEKLAAQQKAEAEQKRQLPTKEVGFVAVSIGEGMGRIFKDLGVDYLIEGGQTMNPSTEDMLKAVDAVNAKTVFILPNNKNIILAANQAKDLCEDKEVLVVPTKTVPQGITAIVNYIADISPLDNLDLMTQEISRIKTGQVTYAVRDTHIDNLEIKEGDIMGIGDDDILAAGSHIVDVAMEMTCRMVEDGAELITVYSGADASKEDTQALSERIQTEFPACDVEVYEGGQPIYYYVISVE